MGDLLRSLTLLVLFGSVPSGHAQLSLSPSAPFSPTGPKDCQAFAGKVDQYSDAISKQHDDCLAAHKADPSTEPPNSLICSRPTCQYLHDILYSNHSFNVKDLRKRVDACYADVKEYLARQALEKQQEEDRKIAGDRRQAEEKARRREEAQAREAKQRGDREEQERVQVAHQQIAPAKIPAKPRAGDRLTPAKDNPPGSPPEQGGSSHSYTTGSMQVNETPEQEQARLAERKQEEKERATQALQEMGDPFGHSSKKAPPKDSASASNGLEDPFRTDKEVAQDKAKEIALDKTESVFHEKVKEAKNVLDLDLQKARSELSPSEFARYKREAENTKAFLTGLDDVIKAAGWIKDAEDIANDPKHGWGGFYHDVETQGFGYVLKRLSPKLSAIYEGPAGWVPSILFDPSSTQTPEQDLDPMTVINDHGHYSFEDKAAALQRIYVSESKHPEIWNDSKLRWFRNMTLTVYNSPDNPNIPPAPP